MSRMLEALKQIQAKSPQTRPAVEPVLSGEMDSPGPQQSPEPDRPVAVCERPEEPAAEATVREPAPDVSRAKEPDRNVARLSSPLAETHKGAYSRLADNILAQLSPSRHAALLFTSAGNGEGKTAAVASLSVVLAEKLSEEIVAVDANFRSPGLANHFGIWADHGLVDVLTGNAPWDDVVRKTGLARLSVLPGGRFLTADGSPPENVNLGGLLDALRLRYRLILVDAASLLHPEVAPLGRLCDGAYLIVQLGQTPRGAARQAAGVIRRCGGHMLGCVLTGVPVERDVRRKKKT